MRRPNQRTFQQSPSDYLEVLAEQAVYIGSKEHKERRWWGGLPRARQLSGSRVGRRRKQDTTICPLIDETDRDRATQWVRAAIRAGQCRFLESDQHFPKKIWYEADGRVWMGLRVNDGLGQYKGWPISEEERDAVFG